MATPGKCFRGSFLFLREPVSRRARCKSGSRCDLDNQSDHGRVRYMKCVKILISDSASASNIRAFQVAFSFRWI